MSKVFLLIAICVCANAFPQSSIPKIIFDTDIGPDYDDVGALTLLHAFADKGECELLATVACNNYANIVPVISVINTYFNRANLPVGMVHGKSVELSAWQKWDSVIVRKYAHALRSNDQAEDAVRLYRRILAAQPDGSVTIVTVGFITNMANLLKSTPDNISPLSGRALVQKKVQKLVSMAGAFPSGKEFNLEKDASASRYTFENWPVPVYFTGWEIGAKIFSGIPLISSSIKNSPVKDVFEISVPKSKEDSNGRKSWDQTAVLMAVRGIDRYYSTVPGRLVCKNDGGNSWDQNGRGHFYVVEKTPSAEVEKVINDLMMHTPK
jgi:pyrimidine-specific ribonucleoside hydrolase